MVSEDFAIKICLEGMAKLAGHGLNLSTAATFLRNRFNGALATYFREDGDEYDVKVRFEPESRTSISNIENVVLYSNNGNKVRVKDVGTTTCPI